MSRAAWTVLLIGLVACERSGGDGGAPAQPVPQVKNPADAAPVGTPAVAAPSGCPPLAVAVKQDGVWIRDQNGQSVIAPCKGEIDRAALGLRLCSLASAAPPGCTAVEVAADEGVKYQQLITVMDAAISVGLKDVGLVELGALSLPLRDPPDPTDKVPPGCAKEMPLCPPRPAATAPSAPAGGPPSPPAGGLADAIVIAVPADGSVQVNGKKVASARQAGTGERIEPLHQSLRAQATSDRSRPVVLQVDRSIDARLVNRIIATARAAGFDNVLFAVRNK